MAKGPDDRKDDLADALAAFASGEQAEDHPAGSGVEEHAHVDLGPAPPKPAPRPIPTPRQAAQPPKPKPPAPARPRTPRAAQRASAPAPAQQRQAPPPAPTPPPQPPPAEPPAPALSHEEEVAREAEAVAHVIEDDDMLNLPAPSPEQLAHRPAPPTRRRAPVARRPEFKQTLIPILLTLGLLLPGLAVWSFTMGEESPVAHIRWVPMTLIAIGAVMLVFAAITMVQVKQQLDEIARKST